MMIAFSILNPLMTGAVIASEMGLLGLLLLTRKELRFRDNRRVAELAEAHDAMTRMQATIDELTADARERESVAVPMQVRHRMTINLHPRAEALRMLRRGSDEHTVSATLNLPLADVTLLRKVSQILCAAKD